MPSWKPTYPSPKHVWVDDFPNFQWTVGPMFSRSLEGVNIASKYIQAISWVAVEGSLFFDVQWFNGSMDLELWPNKNDSWMMYET